MKQTVLKLNKMASNAMAYVRLGKTCWVCVAKFKNLYCIMKYEFLLVKIQSSIVFYVLGCMHAVVANSKHTRSYACSHGRSHVRSHVRSYVRSSAHMYETMYVHI